MYSPADFPSRLRAAPAKKRRLSVENGISSRDAISGLPTLSDSSCASSSAFASSTSASLCSSSERSFGVASSHSGSAFFAADEVLVRRLRCAHLVPPGQTAVTSADSTLDDPPPGLGEDLAECPCDDVEFPLRCDQRRRDLDDGVAAVVRAADQTLLEQAGREEAAQQRLALVFREGLTGLLVLDELECVEE